MLTKLFLIKQTISLILMPVILVFGIIFSHFLFETPKNLAIVTPQFVVAYDINREVDQQRKEATEKHYGEGAGKVAEDALKNNRNSDNSQYKVKSEEPLSESAKKVLQQIKDKGLVDEETKS